MDRNNSARNHGLPITQVVYNEATFKENLFISHTYKKMSNNKTEDSNRETNKEFKNLANNLGIRFLKTSKEFVHDTVVSIANVENFKIKGFDLTFRNHIILKYYIVNIVIKLLILKQCILFLLSLEKITWTGKNILQKRQIQKNYAIYYALPIMSII